MSQSIQCNESTRNSERIRTAKGRVFGPAFDPTYSQMIATRHGARHLNHLMRDVDGVEPFI